MPRLSAQHKSHNWQAALADCLTNVDAVVTACSMWCKTCNPVGVVFCRMVEIWLDPYTGIEYSSIYSHNRWYCLITVKDGTHIFIFSACLSVVNCITASTTPVRAFPQAHGLAIVRSLPPDHDSGTACQQMSVGPTSQSKLSAGSWRRICLVETPAPSDCCF